jgi:hypothetical protein
MKKILMFSLLLEVTSNVFAIPTITKSISTGTTFKFIETLSETLPNGYKVKLDLNNGKGLVAMTCSGLSCSLSSNALPAGTSSVKYKIGIYDSKGVLQGMAKDGTFIITSVANSAYTKISNSGAVLPDTAKLGIGGNDWACTKDSETGLIWEVKTTDGGFRDMKKTYTNYFLGDVGYGSNANSDIFVQAVNKQTLCGAVNWRLPSLNELRTVVQCSDAKYESDGSCTNSNTVAKPTINSTYFPNTVSKVYWSSLRYSDYNSLVYYVSFFNGSSYYNDNKYGSSFVRLVSFDSGFSFC